MMHLRSAPPLLTLVLLLPCLPSQAANPSIEILASHPVDGTLASGGDWLIMLMGWSIPGYFMLPLWIWRRWHDI